MEQNPWEAQICPASQIRSIFLKPEILLPCSQVAAINPYSKPDKSNPHHIIICLYDPF
jgi:hypothetical protein